MKKEKLVKFKKIYVVPHWFGRATLYALGGDGLVYTADFTKEKISGEWKIFGVMKGEVKKNIEKEIKKNL